MAPDDLWKSILPQTHAGANPLSPTERCQRLLFRVAEYVKRYEVPVATGAGWKTIVRQEGNYFRRRVHKFDRVHSDRVRINIHETNGAKSARVNEVRIYDET
jgi:hypothetical protein